MTRRLAGAAKLAGANLAFVASGYVLSLVLARTLQPGRYGLYSVVITLLSAANLVQTQGVPQALSRELAGGAMPASSWRAALRVQRVASLGGCVVLLALAPLFALSDHRLLGGLVAAALALPGYAAFAALLGLLNGQQRFSRQASLLASYAVLRLVAIVGLALAFGLYGAIAGFALAPLAAYALFRRDAPRGGDAARSWRPLARYALGTVGFAAAVNGILTLDLVIVKLVVAGDSASGFYAAAQNVARVPYYALLPAGVVLFPSVAEVAATGDRARLAALVRSGLDGAIAVVLPLVAILVAAPSPVLRLLLGGRYVAAADALRLLAVATGLLALAFALGSVLGGAGHARRATVLTGSALALQLVLCALLARHHGIEGAAAGSFVAAAVALAALAVEVHRRLGASAQPTRLVRQLAAAALCYGIAAQAGTSVAIVLLGLLGCAAYALALVLLRAVPPSFVPRGRSADPG